MNEARWREMYEKVAAEKSVKLFWRPHKKMDYCPIKSNRISSFQDVDLIWKRTDVRMSISFGNGQTSGCQSHLEKDKGIALLINCLEQIGQRNMLIFKELC